MEPASTQVEDQDKLVYKLLGGSELGRDLWMKAYVAMHTPVSLLLPEQFITPGTHLVPPAVKVLRDWLSENGIDLNDSQIGLLLCTGDK